MSRHDSAFDSTYNDNDNSLIYHSEAERLWFILTGHIRDEFYGDPDETAEELARFGQAAAVLVLRDVRAAVEFENEEDEEGEIVAGYREDEDSDEPDLSWGNPRLDVDQLGGEDNIPRIRKMLNSIDGKSAQQAIRLLRLAIGPEQDVVKTPERTASGSSQAATSQVPQVRPKAVPSPRRRDEPFPDFNGGFWEAPQATRKPKGDLALKPDEKQPE